MIHKTVEEKSCIMYLLHSLKNRIIPFKPPPTCWGTVTRILLPPQGVCHSTDFIE